MILLALALLLLISVILSAGIGSVALHPLEIVRVLWHHLGGHVRVDETTDNIVWNLRLPRIALALLVGAALAVAGALMQALFHNPMADPYIVGVSSGAALGAVIIFALGLQATLGGLNAVSLLAFVGGLLVTVLVYVLSRRGWTGAGQHAAAHRHRPRQPHAGGHRLPPAAAPGERNA